MILVDTPVWSVTLRRKSENLAPPERQVTQLLSQIVEEGRATLPGSMRQELLSELREDAQFRRLRDYLRAFPDLQVETSDFEEAARASNYCRAAGIAGPSVHADLWGRSAAQLANLHHRPRFYALPAGSQNSTIRPTLN